MIKSEGIGHPLEIDSFEDFGPSFWYARHGHELMGFESPVRDWESQGDQCTK